MRAVRGTVMAAAGVLLGVGVSACGSAAGQGVAQGAAPPSATAPVTVATADPGTASASPAGSGAASPGASASRCAAQPGTEIIAVDGTSTVGGAFAVVGYEQSAECGPGVPDDVVYTDTGARRTFVLPADVRVVLLGTTPTDRHPGTLADLEALLHAAFATPAAESTASAGYAPPTQPTSHGSMLWSDRFELTLGTGGRITGITSMYQP